MDKYKSYIKLIRINRWIKNIIIFFPLIFSKAEFSFNILTKTVTVFISFCIISSVVYVLNDILDKNRDKNHPIKKFRPIANEIISVKNASILAIFLFVSCMIFNIFYSLEISLILLFYLLNNIFYSTTGKHIQYLDIVLISFGFVLRILAGYIVINEPISALILSITFLFTIFLTSAKRIAECRMKLLKTRTTINIYKEKFLLFMLYVSGCLSTLLYAIFTYKNYNLSLTLSIIPFSCAILRFISLIKNQTSDDDIHHLVFNDKKIKLYFFLFMVLILIC